MSVSPGLPPALTLSPSLDDGPRVIVHADMDAFFAAIEQLDDPSLRGRPVLVGGPVERGVVSTASYEARPFGVGSAMPMAVAVRRVPDAVVLRPRFERYKEVSRLVMGVFAEFAPLVEPLSLDEAFLDVSPVIDRFDGPEALGRALKDAVREVTGGLNVSVGVSGTKFVAKVASDFRKPDGLTVVPPDQARAFLAPLPVKRLWGAGPKTVERLEAAGFRTIDDVARATVEALAPLGRQGAHFFRLAHAIDPRPVVPHREPKSVGWERTLARDVRGPGQIVPLLRQGADEVSSRLKSRGRRGRGVRVKLKTADFRIMTRQCVLAGPTDERAPIAAAAERLLGEFDLAAPMRLVGVTAYDLVAPGEPVQLPLFGPELLPVTSHGRAPRPVAEPMPMT